MIARIVKIRAGILITLKPMVLRSILAVLAGLVAITATSFAIEAAADPLLMKMLAVPNKAALTHNSAVSLITMAYTLVCVVGGGYITARLARRLPVRHALILGLLQAALMVPAMMSFADPGPLWRWVVGMVLVIPAAWAGGAIYARA
jgi:hypothetical protein